VNLIHTLFQSRVATPFIIYGKKIYYFNTSTFTFSQNSPFIHLLSKAQNKNPHIPSFLSNQIAQTLETSKLKLNLAYGAKMMERGKKKQKLQPNPKPTLNKKLKNLS